MVPAYRLSLADGRTVAPLTAALSEGARRGLRPTPQSLDSIAFLQYTGGTTGLSKGAVLTHRNVVAAILQAEAWFTPALARVGHICSTGGTGAAAASDTSDDSRTDTVLLD